MASFKKKCDNCTKEIELNNDSGKWQPYNLDTPHSLHKCSKSVGTGYIVRGVVEDKDDHGKEQEGLSFAGPQPQPISPPFDTSKIPFVDHTQPVKGASKVEIFFGNPEDVRHEYNEFLKVNKDKIKTQGAQSHVTKDQDAEPLLFTIYLYYEEIPK